MLQTPLETDKEILGYKLVERVGSGGFGEVWSAVAPGGLMKALKIVYGFHDGRRAQAELKALDRVKQLRHPFLLSLERIEVHDGQLVVVTELADASLADRFNEYISQGESGIPRSEMLGYIRNAAEALDYLSDEHSLQHLDIKPENLLLVGSHVKVADFGLIKDLQNVSQSLMSGMTPAYAAPELFDGRPVSSSDQYSLAIVYQEMVTGVRPFPGTTPAQLAAQHMHGKPNLRELPKSDQPIVAKALSKDPAVRFASCREFAEELSNQRRAVKKVVRRQNFTRDHADTESRTLHFSSTHGHDVTAVISDEALPFRSTEIKILDPPDVDAEQARVKPTLFIGIGSSGNKVLQKIKSRLVTRYGSMDNIPAVKLLAIDTDRNMLGNLRRQSGSGSLTMPETIEASLRKPEGYRGEKQSKKLLSWLSRRWIYNIPRSLQTEGLRPLGRLAFADHFDTICERIQEGLRSATSAEALATTSDTLNIDPGTVEPRIFIITSTSGGVGSGMALDVAYTARLLAHECGFKPDSINGILMHSTYQRNRDPGLSAANAFAFLTEMRHFIENGYPGDPNIGMPEFEDQAPFEHTYFQDLGCDLRQSEFDGKLDRVAEYLLLSTVSRCSAFFETCRGLEEELEHFALRTFGLSLAGPGNLGNGALAVQRVARGLTRRWLTGDAERGECPDMVAKQLFDDVKLDSDSVRDRVAGVVEEHMPQTLEQIIESAKQRLVNEEQDGSPQAKLDDFGDAMFGFRQGQQDSSQPQPDHCQALETEVGMVGQIVGEELVTKLLDLMSGSAMNLHLAKTAAEKSIEALEQALETTDGRVREQDSVEVELFKLLAKVPVRKAAQSSQTMGRLESILKSYCEYRSEEFQLRQQQVFYRVVLNSVQSILQMLNRFVDQIDMISNEFIPVDGLPDLMLEETGLDMDALLNESVEQGLTEHIDRTEQLVYESLIKQRGGYIESLKEADVWQSQLAFEIREQAQRVLVDAYKKVSFEKVVAQNHIEPERLVKWLNEKMLEAKPELNDCGGESRLLVGQPELSDDDFLQQSLEKQFDVQVSPVKGTQGNFVMCFEAEGVSLANVAFRLLQARPDAIELVKRIQTRNDVDWTTLDDLL